MIRPSLLCLALATLLAAGTGAGAADDWLKRFEGDWTGRGEGRRDAGARPEFTLCTVSNRLNEAGTTLAQSGSCAVGSSRVSIASSIVAGSGSAYSAMANPPGSAGPVTLQGRRSGNSLTLSARFPHSGNGLMMETRIEIAFTGAAAYRITTFASDPSTGRLYQQGRVNFVRK